MSKSSTTQSLFFAVFTLVLLVNPLLRRQNVKLSANESNDIWTETTTITSGKKYIIAATNGANTYFLPSAAYISKAPGAKPLDLENIDSTEAWTFIGNDVSGYTITCDEGYRLYHRNGTVTIESTKHISATYKDNKIWFYQENRLVNNGHYLAHYGSTYNQWRSPTKQTQTDFTTIIRLFEYNDTPLEAATSFAAFVNTGLGSYAKGKCEEYSGIILKYYSDLSSEAKTLLSTSEDIDFINAQNRVTYLEAWTNSEIVVHAKKNINDNSAQTLILITIVSLLTFSGYFLIKKRIKA